MKVNLFAASAVSVLFSAFSAFSASASTIELKLIDSYVKESPFGLAFDGTNIFWSTGFGTTIHKMTTAGVDTGDVFNGPVWSELAWNGSQLLASDGGTLYKFDRDGGNLTSENIAALGPELIDGLDWDNNELWISPDVGEVFRLNAALDSAVGPSPFLGGAGGYSGVERIQATNGTDYVVVVNDATNPRQLCVHNLDASLIGCQTFVNSRYEGLAFDGRYVWAADLFGNKIDKYDILSDGGSIIDPSAVPLPAAGWLMASGLAGLAAFRRRQRNV